MNPLTPLIAPLKARLDQMAPRERILLLGAAAVVMITVLFLLVWEPLVHRHEQRLTQLAAERAVANRLEVMRAELGTSSNGRPAVNRSISLLAAVDQAVRSGSLGTTPSRLQPEGDREVRVWLENAVFDNVLRWVDELDARHGIMVSTMDIERTPASGRVNARLTLIRP